MAGSCKHCNEQSRIWGSHSGEYEDNVFWVVAPCSLVEVYQRFRGPCCLHHHRPDDGGLQGATTQKTAVFIVMNLPIPKSANLLTSWATISFSITVMHGVRRHLVYGTEMMNVYIFFPMALQFLKDLGRLTYRRFLELFRHMVGLLGRVISPS
jgi:hypothetical protein